LIPLLSVMIGVAYLVAGWRGGDRAFGIFGLTVMVATAAGFLLLSRYSETVAGLLDRSDERINRIDQEATTFAGLAVITAVLVGLVMEIARGHNGQPYSILGAIAGVAYLGALVFLRFRR
jgi:hypothetical protein